MIKKLNILRKQRKLKTTSPTYTCAKAINGGKTNYWT